MDLALQLLEHWILVLMFVALMSFMAGVPNSGLGIQNMFHDDEALIRIWVKRSGWVAYLNSPAIFVQCYITVFAVLVWSFIYTLGFVCPGGEAGTACRDAVPETVTYGMIPEVLPHVLVTAAISLFFGMVPVSSQVGTFDAEAGRRKLVPWERLRCLLGAALGLAIGWAILVLASRVEPLIGLPPDIAPTYAVAVPAFIVLICLLLYRKLISGITIVTLFSMILLVYALINTAPEQFHPLILLGILFLIVFCSNLWAKVKPGASKTPAQQEQAPLKFQIPGIVDKEGRDHYLNPIRLADLSGIYSAGENKAGQVAYVRAKASARRTGDIDGHPDFNGKPPIDPVVALQNWKTLPQNNGKKPKLVLVATSGGAYRASFWTGLVLDYLAGLENKGTLDGFCQSVRLITGASGGMVGGAYFTAMMNSDGTPPDSIVKRIEWDIFNSQNSAEPKPEGYRYKRRFPLPRDSLSAVAQQLVQHDIPHLFATGVQMQDRGKVLEDQWMTIDPSFGDIYEAEIAGTKPSIIFSPMLAETGQPLLISNLDMQKINEDFQNESVEFFDWFPHSRDEFRLKTAVRLNAAFPYIAPSAALPTIPYRRVVDAGYYDNYGVDLAVSYLSQPDIHKWIIENTSGVMLMQLRAFPFTLPGEKQPGEVARALQWLTTPVEGIGAARGATMKFRNSQAFRRVENLYNLDPRTDDHFLRTAIFEVSSDTSLSWYMPEREYQSLAIGFWEKVNLFAIAGIEAFWKGDPPPKS